MLAEADELELVRRGESGGYGRRILALFDPSNSRALKTKLTGQLGLLSIARRACTLRTDLSHRSGTDGRAEERARGDVVEMECWVRQADALG